MSRFLRNAINLPDSLSVSVKDSKLYISSLNQSQFLNIPDGIEVLINSQTNSLSIKNINALNALCGTFFKNAVNIINGVKFTHKRTLVISGVGFKVLLSESLLVLNLGLSHPILVEIPVYLNVSVMDNNIFVSGMNIVEVTSFCDYLRKLKKLDVYGGKGIRYFDEILNKKEKKSSKS